MAMTDQQVLQALSDAYAYYGAGVDAHREIARFMQQNNIPVGQVARLTGYSVQDVQADYDAFTAQQAQQDAILFEQQQAAESERFAGFSPDMSANIGSSLDFTGITVDQSAINNAIAQYEAQQAAQQAAQERAAQERAVQQAAQQQAAQERAAQQAAQQAAQRATQQQATEQAAVQQAAALRLAQQQAAEQATQRAAEQQAQQQAQQQAARVAQEQESTRLAEQQAAQLAGDAQRTAQLAAAQPPAAQQQASQQQPAAQQQGQTIMAMTDQQVQDAINTAYAQFGGAGFEAHRAIARFMEANNVSVDQVARLTGYSPQEVQAEFAAQNSPEAKQQQVQEFFQTNPTASDQQIFQYMQQNNLAPDQVIQTMGLDPDDSMRRFNEQVVNTAQPGQVTQTQLQAYFANNPNVANDELQRLMQEFQVSPEQIFQASGRRIGQQSVQQEQEIPTGLRGFEQAAQQGLGDASATIRGAETQSRGDINAAMQNINQLLTQNIGGLEQAGATASGQINTGFDSALEAINRLYGINIDDLRAAASQASGQINTGFDEASGFLQPFQQGGTQAFNQQLALSGALGQDAFNNAFQESPQMAFLREQGMRANLAGAAATGGLGGGNVQRELQRFGQGLASQGLQQQIANLSNLSGMGMQGAQGLSGLATGRAGALGDITLNTAQNVANQRGTQAQSVSGLQTGRAGALGDITLNTAQNIAAQRGAQANFQGQAGVNLANLSQRSGEGIADMQFGTGQDIARQRGRAGELLANQIQNVYANQSRLLQDMGTNQSNLIGGQASDLINMQNAAALRAQQNAINLGGGMSDLQTGLATNTARTIQGTPLTTTPAFDYAGSYADAFNAGAGGYDIMNQFMNETQTAAPSRVSTPTYVRPTVNTGPLRSGYNVNPMQGNFGMLRGADNPFRQNYLLEGLV